MIDDAAPRSVSERPSAAVPADREVLAAARHSALRRQTGWPRRRPSRFVNALIWSLRIYVVLMLLVVIAQLARLA